MKLKTVLSFLFTAGVFYITNAQILYNNATIGITQNAVMIVKGSVLNVDSLSNIGNLHIDSNFTNNGEALGGGNYFVSGNWENNMVFTSDTSTVELNGDNQFIKGDSVTGFYNLTLTGTGIKTQEIDATLDGTLLLNDRELHTDTHTFFVLNNATTAIISTSDSGFVSSDDGGFLSREMQNTATYWFPLGSSDTIRRYRPLDITPQNANAQSFLARFANTNSTFEGYDVTSLDSTLCFVNTAFYHQIGRTSGNDSVAITLYYDNAVDLNGVAIAQWQPTSNWSSTGAANLISNPSPIMSSIAKFYLNDFSEIAFTMGIPGLQKSFSKTDVQCTGDSSGQVSITVLGGTSPYSYLWSNGQNTSSATSLGAGTYSVTITDSTGCSAIDSVTINIVGTPPVLTFSSNNETCVGSSDGYATLTVSGGIIPYTYQWDATTGNQTTQTADSLTSGTYTITVTDSLGCTSTDTVMVSTDSIATVIITGDTVICSGNNATLSAILSGASTGSFLWNTNDTTANITVTPAADSTYSITVAYGPCTVSDSVTLIVNTAPTASITGNNEVCKGNSVMLLANQQADVSYLWSTGSINDTITVLAIVDETVYLTVTNSCDSAVDSLSIIVSNPVANTNNDTTIWAGDDVVLYGSGGITYQWIPTTYLDNPNSQNPTATPEEDIVYSLIITDSLGCSDTTEISITLGFVYDLSVPNVFSPNGDGENDFLFVQGRGHGAEFLQFIIYDRWGEKVFESNCCCAETCGWDGKFRGKKMNTAVYVYILKATVNGNPIEQHGNITLMR